MGEVYELLYCLENSVRELVERTLRESLGPEAWRSDGVPERIRKSAESRRKEELKLRWHGPRGDSLINYVDFPQYGEVIEEDWELFEELVGDRDWLTNYFSEMNISRRALAHAGTLTAPDVERMEFRVRESLRVVGESSKARDPFPYLSRFPRIERVPVQGHLGIFDRHDLAPEVP